MKSAMHELDLWTRALLGQEQQQVYSADVPADLLQSLLGGSVQYRKACGIDQPQLQVG